MAEAVEAAGLASGSLTLELTETVLMQDTETAIVRLQELRQLDVRLAIDDFGTGYSSLRYLQRPPIDVLKVASRSWTGWGAGRRRARSRARSSTLPALSSWTPWPRA